jgi:hypothetical protein
MRPLNVQAALIAAGSTLDSRDNNEYLSTGLRGGQAQTPHALPHIVETVEQTRVRTVPPPHAALRPAALSCAPCRTAHMPSQAHRTPCEHCCVSPKPTTFHSHAPHRCNVNNAPYKRRCWCNSAAHHTRGTSCRLGGSASTALGSVVGSLVGAAWGDAHSPADVSSGEVAWWLGRGEDEEV